MRREQVTLSVLFYEDNLEDIALSLRTLKAGDFEVIHDVAVTAGELLARVRGSAYDVILSDYHMPGQSGKDVFDLLKSEGVDIPFILVTGSLGDEKCVECLKSGIADYVLKDRLARLPAAIRRALEDQRLRRERELAEEALRRSQASYYSLIQSAPCGMLRLNAGNGQLLEVNPALAEMLGYDSPAELLRNGAEGGIALDRKFLETLTRERGPANQVIKYEVEWRRQDGCSLQVELRGRLLRDKTGAPCCLEMIAENITERRQAQLRIRQLNDLYSVLSQAGRAIVRIRTRMELFQEICRIVVEQGGFRMAWVALIQFTTGTVTSVASWPRQDEYLKGLNLTIHGDAPGCGPIACAVREGQSVVCNDVARDSRMESWWQRAERRGFRSMSAFPLVVHGRTLGAVAIYAGEVGFFGEENLTLLEELTANISFALESMEAERMRNRAVDELDQFFALSLDLLCIFNLDGYIHRLNPAWERILGFTPAEICGRPWIDFVHPDDRPRAEATLANLRSGVEIGHFEFRFLSRSGQYRCLIGSTTPALEQDMVFAVMTDITDRKYLEEQLRSQNIALEEQNRRVSEASRLKSEFLANMSHELRSPLNGIIGFTELLYDGKLGPLPDRPREVLGRVHASASHLLQLINGVLDLSKVEAGQLELFPERVLVSTLIQEVTGILGPMAVEKQIRIETSIDNAVDEVTIDARRFKQILYNFLSNAIKFTGPEGLIQVKLAAEGAGEFRLEVSDTGVGISPEDLGRLFVDFQQLDATAAKRYQGTGLGLALTKRLVEAQGGRVGLESTPGQGSTFFAVLPRIPAGIASAHATVLAIEDQRLERALLTRMLQGAGYAVETAVSGEEALEKCRRWRFDAITLDLLLPDGPGWELLEQIRKIAHHRTTPVIVVSMLDQKDLQRAPLAVQGYLTKPIEGKALWDALEKIGLPIRNTKEHDERQTYSDRG
jgi:PAS domain S-box-containing protein